MVFSGKIPDSFASGEKHDLVKAISFYKAINYISFVKSSKSPNFCFVSSKKFAQTISKINVYKRELKKLSKADLLKDKDCNFVYIDDDSGINLPKYVKNNLDDVIVSDMKNFVKAHEGIVELAEKNGKIGFVLNLKKAKRAGIKISSKLIESAQKVY